MSLIPTINRTTVYSDPTDNYTITEVIADKYAIGYSFIKNGKTSGITTHVFGDVDCIDSDLNIIQASVPPGWTLSDYATTGWIHPKVNSESATWVCTTPIDSDLNRIVGSGYSLTPSETLQLTGVLNKRLYLYKPCSVDGVDYPAHTVFLFDTIDTVDLINKTEDNIAVLFEVI